MSFEEWWRDVYCPAHGMENLSDARSILIASVKREAAAHAWEAAQMMCREDMAKELRRLELESRNNAKQSRKKPHEKPSVPRS